MIAHPSHRGDRTRTRSTLILASALSLALLAVPLATARAAKPQPPPPTPQLVAVLEASIPGCGALIAIDDRGTLYADCGVVGNWQVAGQIAGTPVHMVAFAGAPRHLLVTMMNGDVWASGLDTFPLTFTLLSNVFASAGTAPRILDLAPFDPAPPIITNEPEPDAPGVPK